MNEYLIYFVLIPVIVAAMAFSFFSIGKIMGRREERLSHDSKVLEQHGLASH